MFFWSETTVSNKGIGKNGLAFVKACVVTREIVTILKKRELDTDDVAHLDMETRRLGLVLTEECEGLSDKFKPNLSVPKVHAVVHYS